MLTPARLVAALAFTAVSVRAAPFGLDPYYPQLDGPTPLNASNPASGLAESSNLVEAVVPTEVGASYDLDKLETFVSDTFGDSLERNFDNLSDAPYLSGAVAAVPWPASTWERDDDGINLRWNRTNTSLSAAEKYAKFADLDVKEFTDAVSAVSGIDSLAEYSTECTEDSDCESFNGILKGYCVKRHGAESGYCGRRGNMNHARCLAAYLEPEPDCAIKYDDSDVVFEPNDIEGLLTQVYHEAELDVVVLGSRFWDEAPSVANRGVDPTDKYGRYLDPLQRDLNAGLFHIAVTNLVGAYQSPLVLDTNEGSGVFNNPVRSFNITNMTLIEDIASISTTHFGTETYPFNDEAVYLAEVQLELLYASAAIISEGGIIKSGKSGNMWNTGDEKYSYLLELDEDKNIIGGEWIGSSRKNHPDLLWFPASNKTIDEDFETSYGLKYADIKALVMDSKSVCA